MAEVRETFSDYEEEDYQSFIASTRRVAETVEKYRRTYHNSTLYPFPVDEEEKDRLDCRHKLFCLSNKLVAGQELLLTNIQNVQIDRVLDVGTGTGLWAMDFADDHPETHVIGVDIFPMYERSLPPNLECVIDDLERDWGFTFPFTLIHYRADIIQLRPQAHFFAQAKDNLSPGGYLECTWIEFPMHWSTEMPESIRRWSDHMMEAISKAGFTAEYSREAMERDGFTNVRENVCEWPMNTGHKDCRTSKKKREIAAYSHATMCDSRSLRSLSLSLLVDVLEMSERDVLIMLAMVGEEMNKKNNVASWRVHTLMGQKPIVDGESSGEDGESSGEDGESSGEDGESSGEDGESSGEDGESSEEDGV